VPQASPAPTYFSRSFSCDIRAAPAGLLASSYARDSAGLAGQPVGQEDQGGGATSSAPPPSVRHGHANERRHAEGHPRDARQQELRGLRHADPAVGVGEPRVARVPELLRPAQIAGRAPQLRPVRDDGLVVGQAGASRARRSTTCACAPSIIVIITVYFFRLFLFGWFIGPRVPALLRCWPLFFSGVPTRLRVMLPLLLVLVTRACTHAVNSPRKPHASPRVACSYYSLANIQM
jgi:hypothetical protein